MIRSLLVSFLALMLFGCGAGGPAGTYKLDKPALAKAADAMVAEMAADKDSPMAGMAKMMADSLKSMEVTMILAADGMFTANSKMQMMGQTKESVVKGTWKLDGDKLTMTTTEEDGKPKSETKTGTYQNGKITVSEDQGGKAMEIVFTRS